MTYRLVLWLALACASIAAHPQEAGPTPTAATVPRPPVIPAADFARSPRYYDPDLSPAGTQVLARTVVDGRERLLVHNLGSGAAQLVPMPDAAELRWFRWAGETRILVSLAWPLHHDDEDSVATRLVVLDLTTRETRVLGDRQTGPEGDDVLYVDPAGGWLLLSLQKDIYEYPGVYRVDLATGARQRVVKPQPHVWEWYADEAGVVRAGLGFLARSWFMLYRQDGDAPFRRVGKASYEDESATIDLLRLVPGADRGFVLSDERTGRYALYRYDFATQKIGELVFESATNDVEDYALSRDGREVVAVFYTDDRERVQWLEPRMRERQLALERRLPGQDVYFVARDDRETRFVVWAGGASEPGAYYLYEPSSAALQLLARLNDRLDPTQLARTEYATYRARDGLEIPAYLTLPVGREPRGLPLVVMPHGGPYFVRDVLGFNPEVQFLANRGYAVLQPNFRGSSGYGFAFHDKGAGQWGRGMQDDLDDGVAWLASRGVVDAGRVCVAGSSYGGYAALWAVTRNPERYRCAASLAGVTDVPQQLRYQSVGLDGRDRLDWRQTVVGDDARFDLESISPLQQARRLTRPVLVAHGDADTRVPFKQSVRYRDALVKAGKPVEFVAYAGAGHDMANPADLTDWLERLGAFLARHNPADPPAATH